MRRFARGCVGALLLGAAAGCGAELGGTGAASHAAAAAEPVIAAVQPAAEPPRTVLMDTIADLTGDGTPERVQLYVDAERDARGRIMWDDGQRWLLQVRRGEAVYPLFDDYVQLGRLRFWVVEPNEGGAADVVLLKETGAGLELTTYRWEAVREGFAREQRYRASGNVVLASPEVR